MEKTTNYQLNKPEVTDPMRLADFNENADKIDAALKTKANLAFGTYTGTGTGGEQNPITLTFDFKPRFIRVFFISSGAMINFYELTAMEGIECATVYGNYLNSSYQNKVYLTWGENSISWYSPGDAIYQLNNLDTVYHYMVLG